MLIDKYMTNWSPTDVAVRSTHLGIHYDDAVAARDLPRRSKRPMSNCSLYLHYNGQIMVVVTVLV